MNLSQLMELGEIIDKACASGDSNILNNQIKYIQSYVETLDDSEEKVYLYYFLANAWNGLRTLKHKNDENSIWKLEQKEVFREIFFLRKAIAQKNFGELNIDYKLSIYTNLGNIFSHYGRTINALKYYDKALTLYPKFFMALANKAMCLETYAKLDYDHSHQDFLLRYAYFDYKKASVEIQNYLKQELSDIQYYEGIQSTIRLNSKIIENYLSTEWLEVSIDLNNYKLGNGKNEIHYRKWVLENKLFLNPMNDLGNFSIAAQDTLNLPDLIIELNIGFPKYITYFNQIKQEYIAYRHLLFEGLNEFTKKFYDEETLIIDDYDYNLYDINIEKIKIAFRGFYSLFDKMANFMNEYFDLGLNERQVDFRRVWYLNIKKQQVLNPVFDQNENLALRGLYLISKDLYFNNKDEESREFIDVLEPEAEEINKIRNHLEHKFIMIKMFDTKELEQFSERERCFAITEKDLESKTIHLGQLIREAIIYLSFAVHIEENKKDVDGKCASMPLNALRV